MPRMPKTFAHRIMDAEETRIRLLLRLGAATVFLPCGFTQAFSSTRSRPAASGSCRDVARLALDGSGALSAWLASALAQRKSGQFFFKFSGALVVVLGLWNIQNGLTLALLSLSSSRLCRARSISAAQGP